MGRRVSFTLFQKGAEEFGGRAGKRVAYLKSPYLSLPGGGGVRADSVVVLPSGDPGPGTHLS